MADKWYNRFNPFYAAQKAQAEKEEAIQSKLEFEKKSGQETKELTQKLDAIAGEFKDSINYEVKFFDSESSNYSGAGFTELSGIDQIVNATTLAKIYTSETWVYVAVNAIAQTIAGLPIKLEKRHTVKKSVRNELTGKDETVEQEIWVDASGENLAKRFQFPNSYCSKTEFYTLLLIDLLTAGQYYVWLDSDQDLTSLDYTSEEDPNSPFGRLRQLMASDTPIKAMYRIPPALMRPEPTETGLGVELYVMQSDKGTYAYNPAEIVHVKLPNPMDPHGGLSPLIPAFKPVLIDRFSTEHMIRFYKSGARLGGVIQTDKGLNKEQLSRFQRSFENNYTGRANHHRTLILPPGMNYQPIEQNPAQIALLDFCRYNREAVLAAYRVPPIKAGILDGSNYANARAQLKTFFKDTIIPMLGYVQDGFNRKNTLMPDIYTYRIKFNLDDVEELQDDGLALANVAKGMLDSGATVNEVRQKVWKLRPIDEGDQSPVIAKIKRDTFNQQIGLGHLPNADTSDQTDEQPNEEISASQEAMAKLNVIAEAVASILDGTKQEETAEGDAPAEEIKDAPTGPGTDVVPTKVTFGQRVTQLVAQYVQQGIPLNQAVPKAIEQAKAEGFDPNDEDPSDPDGTPPAPNSDGSGAPDQSTETPIPDSAKSDGPTLDQFLRDRLDAMGDSPINSEVINLLISEFETVGKAPDKIYAAGLSKEMVTAEWKGFIEKSEPLIAKRLIGVKEFFDKLKSIIMKRIGANLKAYGIHKARDSDDVEEILKKSGDIEALIKAYSEKVDKNLEQAMKFGYNSTLAEIKLGGSEDKDLVEQVRKYLASKITGVTDTTIEQLRSILVEKFESGAPFVEVSTTIREKFSEIDSGRAITIARNETLTAISLGRESKRQDIKKEFPEKVLKKMWVSAQDDDVRDSHEKLDGISVGIDEKFENGLMYPRDPSGDAEEVVNCRCTDITYLEEQQQEIDQSLNSDEKKHYCRSGAHKKGGPGSGCSGSNCGRPSGDGTTESNTDGISKETAALIARREKGKGEPVKLSREQLNEVLDNGTFALVSAGKNPKIEADMALTNEQISERYKNLESSLKESGYAYTAVQGHYSGKEDSFLIQIHEAEREEIIQLGEKYNQDSIIFTQAQKNEMVYTTGADKGKSVKGTGYSWEDNADDFYTEVGHPDGTVSKFQLKFNFDEGPKRLLPNSLKISIQDSVRSPGEPHDPRGGANQIAPS
jgi:HK97 family phage portal protein